MIFVDTQGVQPETEMCVYYFSPHIQTAGSLMAKKQWKRCSQERWFVMRGNLIIS